MAIQAIFASRFANSFTVLTGGAADGSTTNKFWSLICVDYGNEGSENAVPTLSFVNEVVESSTNNSGSLGDKIGILLPISAEGVAVSSRRVFIQYVHPRWAKRGI